MPFFFLSFLLSLLTSLLHCSSCLSSKTTDPRSSLSLRASFHFICPLLDGGRPRPLSLSLSSVFYFSLSLFPFHPRLHFLRPFEPRRPSLCNIINTAKFTSVYIHHAPRVQHSRRGEKPRAFSTSTDQSGDRLLLLWGPRILLFLRFCFSADDEPYDVSNKMILM